MKQALCIAIASYATTMAFAQDHLTPEPGILAEAHEYHAKLREVFAEVYEEQVLLQVVLLRSFQPEEIAGIRKTDSALEAFVAKPSSHIWETYSIYEAESEEERQADREGRDFALDPKSTLAEMKSQFPSEFRKISIHTDAHPIPAPLKERIESVWQKMLLGARHPKNPRLGVDGATYHFSMFILEHGIVSGEVWSPDRGKMRALTDLAEGLVDYARGRIDEKKLTKLLRPLER